MSVEFGLAGGGAEHVEDRLECFRTVSSASSASYDAVESVSHFTFGSVLRSAESLSELTGLSRNNCLGYLFTCPQNIYYYYYHR